MILSNFGDIGSILDPFLGQTPIKLTLDPSGDESLPVRFQELQINAFPVKTRSNLPPSVALGMESI